MDHSVIISDEVTKLFDEEIKTIPTSFNENNITCKTGGFYILVTFLLINITLLIAVSIYCSLINYRPKQRLLLPFHDTKLKQVWIGRIN